MQIYKNSDNNDKTMPKRSKLMSLIYIYIYQYDYLVVFKRRLKIKKKKNQLFVILQW